MRRRVSVRVRSAAFVLGLILDGLKGLWTIPDIPDG
jgi:hypothetical protein